MILRCIIFTAVILLFKQSLFSQISYVENQISYCSVQHTDLKISNNYYFGFNHTFPKRFSDTLVLKAINVNEIQDKVVHPRWIKDAVVPASLIIAGAITLLPESHCLLSKHTIQEKMLGVFPGINTPIDNYLQFVPLAAILGLKVAGVKSRSDFVNQVAIMAKAELLMGAIVHGMKTYIRMERPSGCGMNTMPSGHTAQAFVAATILDMEYRDASPWISVTGYAVASTTAIGRIVNNKHWISDVLIGAGIGIFSAKVVYATHRYRWGKKTNVVILPAIYKNGGGLSFAMVL